MWQEVYNYIKPVPTYNNSVLWNLVSERLEKRDPNITPFKFILVQC